jgi:hypothetical protein
MRVSAGVCVCVVVPSLYCNFVPWCLESSFLSISLYWQRNVLPPSPVQAGVWHSTSHRPSPIAHHTARTWRYVWGAAVLRRGLLVRGPPLLSALRSTAGGEGGTETIEDRVLDMFICIIRVGYGQAVRFVMEAWK